MFRMLSVLVKQWLQPVTCDLQIRPAEFRNVITIFPQKITDLKATNLSSKELKKLSFDKLAILPWMPEVFSLTSGEERRSSAGRRETTATCTIFPRVRELIHKSYRTKNCSVSQH